jgi:hypothetical protein
MDETLPWTEGKRNAHKTLVAIAERKRPLKRPGLDGIII